MVGWRPQGCHLLPPPPEEDTEEGSLQVCCVPTQGGFSQDCVRSVGHTSQAPRERAYRGERRQRLRRILYVARTSQLVVFSVTSGLDSFVSRNFYVTYFF